MNVLSQRLLVTAGVVLLTAAAVGSPLHYSGAAFTSSSTNAPSTVRAAADWTPPTVSLVDPGSPLKGAVAVTAQAADGESGVASVTVQYASSGGSVWVDACTAATAPYTCSWNTTGVPDGRYDLRARATDRAGYATTSAVVKDRQVNNSTVSSVVLEDPGTHLSGNVSLRATAGSTSGVQSVAVQRAPATSNTWSTVCTVTTSPYTCSWNTSAVADGLYDLRAVLVDGRGTSTTSDVLSNRRVDNTAPRGADVQVTNGAGSTVGRPDAGDVITFTYSEVMALSSIVPGWNGAALQATVRLRDGTTDTLDVLTPSGAVVNLGSVNVKGDYVKNGTVQFPATMTASTTTVNGTPRTEVRLVLGSAGGNSNGQLHTVTTASFLEWTPSSAAKDLAGNPASAVVVMESGATADTDF